MMLSRQYWSSNIHQWKNQSPMSSSARDLLGLPGNTRRDPNVRRRHESPPQPPKCILYLRWNPILRFLQRFPTLKNRSGWRYSYIYTQWIKELGKEMGKSKAKMGKKGSRPEYRHWEAESKDCENWEAEGSNRWSRLGRENCQGIWAWRERNDRQTGDGAKNTNEKDISKSI